MKKEGKWAPSANCSFRNLMTLLSKWDDRPLFKRNTKYFIGRLRNYTG